MSKTIIEVNDDNFDKEILKSDKPVLLDFWAPWCGPCKAIGPVIDGLAADYGDRVTFAKMNVDDNPATPSQYEVRAIPTLMIFKDGKVSEQATGMMPKTKIEDLIKKAL